MGSLTEISISNVSSDEEDNSNQTDASIIENLDANLCVVCLRAREATWIFMPCKHANCYEDCSTQIEELGEACPTCRSVI